MKSIWKISKVTPLLAQDAVNVEFENLCGNLYFPGLVMRVHGFKPEVGGKFAFEYIPAETEFQRQSRMENEAQQVWASQGVNAFNAANQYQDSGNREWFNDAGTGTMQNQASQFISNPALPYVAITAFKAALPDPSIFGIDVKPEESESDRIARVTQSMCK